MADKEKLKQVGAIIAAVLSVGYLLHVLFPDLSSDVTVQLKSLWSPTDEASMSSPTPSESAGTSPNGKSKKEGLGSDAGSPVLDLSAPSGLSMLSEDLLEDSLWEENVVRSRPEGMRSGQAVLDAIAEIEAWSPIENGYSPERLTVYLRYPKLWVRLTAYAFALKAKVLSESEEVKLARLITLKNRDNPHQVRRFLTRYERKDPALFQQLMKRLVPADSSPTEEPPTLEIEEDSSDAS